MDVAVWFELNKWELKNYLGTPSVGVGFCGGPLSVCEGPSDL